MPAFPSPEWVEAYKTALNERPEFREAGQEWEGDVAYVLEAEPDKGVLDEVRAWFDLWHGECRDAREVDADTADRARFVISGAYSQWKDVLLGKLDPTKAMVQGKLRLKGDLPTIVRQVGAVNALVDVARTIPTQFPDD